MLLQSQIRLASSIITDSNPLFHLEDAGVYMNLISQLPLPKAKISQLYLVLPSIFLIRIFYFIVLKTPWFSVLSSN